MASCATCGTSTGLMGPKECASCRSQREARETAAAERERQAYAATAAEELLDATQGLFDLEYDQVRATVEAGRDAYLYRSVYIPVDSEHEGQAVANGFDISLLQILGRAGWEVIGFVPRTLGTALTNISIGATSGKTYGGGIGGTVLGVYVLLRVLISASNLADAVSILAAETGLEDLEGARLP